jgi:hypothetical protein
MAPMLTERCRFTLNVVQDKLYAIGGASENVEDGVNNTVEGCACECYDPTSGKSPQSIFDQLIWYGLVRKTESF